MATFNRIAIKTYNLRRGEALAAAALKPGHLLMRTSADKVQKHNTADVFVAPYVALENLMAGKGVSDDYAADDTVEYAEAQRGEQYWMWLTTSQTIAIGDQLGPNNAGELKAVGSGKQAFCAAREAVTTTGAAARILVEIL